MRTGRTIIDISMPLSKFTPVWPGSDRFELKWLKTVEKDGFNESALALNSHMGTHFDFPFHYVKDGKKLGDISLDVYIGQAFVLDCRDSDAIGPDLLESATIPSSCTRLLLKTRNSLISRHDFTENYVGLSPEGAGWLLNRGIELIGIDYLSIEAFRGNNRTHKLLLENGIIILEGLMLRRVVEGLYYLIAVPLSIPQAEGSPARAILLDGEKA